MDNATQKTEPSAEVDTKQEPKTEMKNEPTDDCIEEEIIEISENSVQTPETKPSISDVKAEEETPQSTFGQTDQHGPADIVTTKPKRKYTKRANKNDTNDKAVEPSEPRVKRKYTKRKKVENEDMPQLDANSNNLDGTSVSKKISEEPEVRVKRKYTKRNSGKLENVSDSGKLSGSADRIKVI